MPQADVVVVGAGLAGLTAAIALTEAGATVEVVAAGHAASHWTGGGFDVAAPAGSPTARHGIAELASRPGHPYGILGGVVGRAIIDLRTILAAEGLVHRGDLDSPLRAIPTAIGATRRAAILPEAQAGALEPWGDDERLVVCGIAGFKDFWPEAIATSLARAWVWGQPGCADRRPVRIEALMVELPGLAGRRNLNALELARRFDDPAWRQAAFATMARTLERGGGPGGRVALPAVLGLDDHAAVLDEARRSLPLVPFEMSLVPPSIPGLRLHQALRGALRRRGGRLLIGEPVLRVLAEGRRVAGVATATASRDRVIRTGGLILATGGIAGGGLIGRSDGIIEEPILGLPVEAPPADDWLAEDPFEPRGHPLESAGIRTDSDLRPVDAQGEILFDNVAIVGSLLAGQRYLSERCGDGVAVASGRLAAVTLGSPGSGDAEEPPPASHVATEMRP